MRRIATVATAAAVVALMTLSGCSSRTESGTGGEEAAGFEAGSLVGVALPDKTSENWVLAGKLFEDAIKKAGFEGDVQYAGASTAVADQQSQISSMVTNGAKVIIVGAKDGGQLSAQVKEAHDAGAVVIAYDRLILNSDDVDYYVAFDNFKVGQLQGQALLDGMKEKKPEGPYNIELFSGSPDDANAAVFFNGAMDVLQPLIDSGDLVVVSGQTDVGQTATQGWLAQNAQTRMDTLLQGNYTNTELDGVLSPNDTLARAIITSVGDAGKPIPTVTGQDSEAASIPLIMSGEQYMTIYKDTRALVDQTLAMVTQLSEGGEADVNDTETYDNGNKIVPSFLLAPVVVTKDNAAEVYADNPDLLALTK